MTRLRTYVPMRRVSVKRRAEAETFAAVYRLVDKRSEGQCEFIVSGDAGTGPYLAGARCRKRATDHHHCVKPRRSHHSVNEIIHLCRAHHDRCEGPFVLGRLVVTPLGNERFRYTIRYASDKFANRREEP